MAGVVRYQLVLGDLLSDIGTVSYTESTGVQDYVLATGTTDTSMSLAGVTTADVLYLKSDQALTMNINASDGTDITIDANKPVLFTGTSVTAVYLSNASGSSANIKFAAWGA